MPVRVKRSPFERSVIGGMLESSNVGSNVKSPNTPKNGEWIDTFISAIMTGASVTRATRKAGVHITLPYKRRIEDEAFRNAWKQAADIGTELMEQEAARRAYHGTLKPVFHKGQKCGFVREYSDTLMIFMLKARKPEVYREGIEDSGSGRGMVLNINVVAVDGKSQQQEQQLIEVEVVNGSKQDLESVREAATVLAK